MSRIRVAAAVLSIAMLAVFAAGCGDDATSDTSSSKAKSTESKAGDEAAGGTVEASLEIVVDDVGSKKSPGIAMPQGMACTKSIPATCRGTVTCPAADDAPPTEHDACAWLATEEATETLFPEASDEPRACTMQYGGPETASVTGTLDGKPVNIQFTRGDGCKIAAFDAAARLWGVVPAPVGSGPAAASCLAADPDAPVSSSDDPRAGQPDGMAADESCGEAPSAEPQAVDDPPSAFEK